MLRLFCCLYESFFDEKTSVDYSFSNDREENDKPMFKCCVVHRATCFVDRKGGRKYERSDSILNKQQKTQFNDFILFDSKWMYAEQSLGI